MAEGLGPLAEEELTDAGREELDIEDIPFPEVGAQPSTLGQSNLMVLKNVSTTALS